MQTGLKLKKKPKGFFFLCFGRTARGRLWLRAVRKLHCTTSPTFCQGKFEKILHKKDPVTLCILPLDFCETPWYNVITKDEREVAKMFAITLYKEIWVTCKTREEAEQRMAIIKTAPIYKVHPAGAFKIVKK